MQITPLETAWKAVADMAWGLSLARPGPVAWCHRCHRKHPRGRCSLTQVERTVTHGNRRGRRRGRPPVKRLVWAHVAPKSPAKPKTKARKS